MAATGLYTPDFLSQGGFSRVVSLVPSLTETLAGLGLADKLVGRTRFCISSPALLGHIPRVGGTKDPRLSRIAELKPDLILSVKEENRPEDAQALAEDFPVLVFDIKTVSDALDAVRVLGNLLGADSEKVQGILHEANALLAMDLVTPRLQCLYLIWKEPWMTIGTDTYIASMLRVCGMELADITMTRYPVVDMPTFLKSHPVDAILLSSEPYPFKEAEAAALQAEFGIPTYCVDGQLLSWYGTLTPAGLRYGQSLYSRLREG